jgi:hypothetical protein
MKHGLLCVFTAETLGNWSTKVVVHHEKVVMDLSKEQTHDCVAVVLVGLDLWCLRPL